MGKGRGESRRSDGGKCNERAAAGRISKAGVTAFFRECGTEVVTNHPLYVLDIAVKKAGVTVTYNG
jgi:hypothetical protein